MCTESRCIHYTFVFYDNHIVSFRLLVVLFTWNIQNDICKNSLCNQIVLLVDKMKMLIHETKLDFPNFLSFFLLLNSIVHIQIETCQFCWKYWKYSNKICGRKLNKLAKPFHIHINSFVIVSVAQCPYGRVCVCVCVF